MIIKLGDIFDLRLPLRWRFVGAEQTDLTAALVLGDRAAIDRDEVDAFLQTGVGVDAGPVVLINVFTVDPIDQDALVEALRDDAEAAEARFLGSRRLTGSS